MSYADKRQLVTWNFDSTLAGAGGVAYADNADLSAIVVPIGREVEIQSMNGYVITASDGADFIELVKEDDTVLCKIALQTTGAKAAVLADGSTPATFPIRVAAQSVSALKVIKLKADGATDTSTSGTIQFEITGL